jgi:hypothetical protein
MEEEDDDSDALNFFSYLKEKEQLERIENLRKKNQNNAREMKG